MGEGSSLVSCTQHTSSFDVICEHVRAGVLHRSHVVLGVGNHQMTIEEGTATSTIPQPWTSSSNNRDTVVHSRKSFRDDCAHTTYPMPDKRVA
eukprot:4429623-Pyramimonas_sp.AAC.3